MGELEKHVGLHDGALISPEPDVLTFSIGLFSASVYLSSRQDGPKRSLVRFIFGKDQTAPNGVEPFCLVFFFSCYYCGCEYVVLTKLSDRT